MPMNYTIALVAGVFLSTSMAYATERSIPGESSRILVAQADDVRATGQATIDIRRSKPNRKELRTATTKAKMRAVESYVSRDQSAIDTFDRCLRDDLEENIDDFVSAYEVNNQATDAAARQLQVTVRVSINHSRLQNHLRRCKGSSPDRGLIAFVFIACEQLGPDQYRALRANADVARTIQEVFLANGFRVMANTQMEANSGGLYKRSALEAECARDGNITWLPAQRAAEMSGSDYFAFGTFDIGASQTDNVTGLERVAVSVDAQLLNISSVGSELLAVIGDVGEPKLGKTVEEATLNARKGVARELAERMVSQLVNQGVH